MVTKLMLKHQGNATLSQTLMLILWDWIPTTDVNEMMLSLQCKIDSFLTCQRFFSLLISQGLACLCFRVNESWLRVACSDMKTMLKALSYGVG